jgi:hypothetical protein
MAIKKQSEFPLWNEYAKHFELNENVIFALYPDIYTNSELTPDLLIHEKTHLKQQVNTGLDKWVKQYLENPHFRLNQEIEAYQNQIKSFRDKNQRHRMRTWASETLSSSLYGNIISKQEVYRILK